MSGTQAMLKARGERNIDFTTEATDSFAPLAGGFDPAAEAAADPPRLPLPRCPRALSLTAAANPPGNPTRAASSRKGGRRAAPRLDARVAEPVAPAVPRTSTRSEPSPPLGSARPGLTLAPGAMLSSFSPSSSSLTNDHLLSPAQLWKRNISVGLKKHTRKSLLHQSVGRATKGKAKRALSDCLACHRSSALPAISRKENVCVRACVRVSG